MPVASSWGLDDPELAERAVAQEQLDVVMVGRAHLVNPHWPYMAAQKLNLDKAAWLLPPSYAYWVERYAKSSMH